MSSDLSWLVGHWNQKQNLPNKEITDSTISKTPVIPGCSSEYVEMFLLIYSNCRTSDALREQGAECTMRKKYQLLHRSHYMNLLNAEAVVTAAAMLNV